MSTFVRFLRRCNGRLLSSGALFGGVLRHRGFRRESQALRETLEEEHDEWVRRRVTDDTLRSRARPRHATLRYATRQRARGHANFDCRAALTRFCLFAQDPLIAHLSWRRDPFLPSSHLLEPFTPSPTFSASSLSLSLPRLPPPPPLLLLFLLLPARFLWG